MSIRTDQLIDALKAAGEPTRLRILALVREGDLAVGELVQILQQSQPRLSHHLKTLTQAGLVERLPEGAWVFYRAANSGWARRVLDRLFSELDLQSDDFVTDRHALKIVRENRTEAANMYFANIAEKWDHIRNSHYPTADIETALLSAAGSGQFSHVIDLGTGTGRILSLFAPHAVEAEGLDQSHQMLTVARANLAKANILNARVRQGDVANTPFADESADIVIIHQVLHYLEDPGPVFHEAARILNRDGKLLVVDFAPHDLEFLRDQQGHRRLGLRETDMENWAKSAGLKLQKPIRFDPPEDLEQGLAVNLWAAHHQTHQLEAAA